MADGDFDNPQKFKDAMQNGWLIDAGPYDPHVSVDYDG